MYRYRFKKYVLMRYKINDYKILKLSVEPFNHPNYNYRYVNLPFDIYFHSKELALITNFAFKKRVMF
jgi:hypothetical protein